LANERRIVASTDVTAEQNPPAALVIGDVDPFGAASSPPAARGTAAQVSLRGLLRFKWTIILVALLVGAPAATAVWLCQKPLYQARGEIGVNPTPTRLIYNVPENTFGGGFEKYFNSQARAIRNASVLSAVLEDPAVKNTEWYSTDEYSLLGGKLSHLDRLGDALEVRPGNGTNLMDVVVTTTNPSDGAAIVNSILEHYLDHTIVLARQSAEDRTHRLDSREQGFLAQKRGHEETIAGMLGPLEGRSPDTLYIEATSELRKKESALEELERSKQHLTRKREELIKAQAATGSEPSTQPSTQPTRPTTNRYDEDPAWYAAYMELRRAKEDLDALLSVGLTERNPRVETARNRVKNREEELRRREKILDERPLVFTSPAEPAPGRVTASTLAAQILDIDIQRDLLAETITKLTAEVRKLGALMAVLADERSELHRVEAVLADIQKMQTERQVEDGTPGTVTIEARAIASTRPSNTNKRIMYLAMTILGGLAVGIMTAFMRASFNPLVDDAEEMASMGQSPFLGYLPWIDNPRRPRPEEHALQSEAVRVVRTALIERTNGNTGRAILITSAGPDAGKTSIAVALSRSLAACGKRVLLVDADLRRPSVAERLGIEHGPGLLAVLRNGAGLANGGVVALSSTFHVMPASGPIQCSSETEPLANGVFGKALERWRREYDVVLFDTPPVLPVADATILARQLDGALFVVRESHCRRSDVLEALASLRSTGSHLVGTIVFGSSRRSRYESSYYSYYRAAEPGESGLVVAPKDRRE
jgi:capsular exopolysaccharide synthesis family protein